jgi:hypothetical protein
MHGSLGHESVPYGDVSCETFWPGYVSGSVTFALCEKVCVAQDGSSGHPPQARGTDEDGLASARRPVAPRGDTDSMTLPGFLPNSGPDPRNTTAPNAEVRHRRRKAPLWDSSEWGARDCLLKPVGLGGRLGIDPLGENPILGAGFSVGHPGPALAPGRVPHDCHTTARRPQKVSRGRRLDPPGSGYLVLLPVRNDERLSKTSNPVALKHPAPGPQDARWSCGWLFPSDRLAA